MPRHTGRVRRRERELIMKQGAVRADDPRDRNLAHALETDLEGSPLLHRRLRERLRNFRPSADTYLAAMGGPLPYMLRLRQIADETRSHEEELERRRIELAAECSDDADFERRWLELAESWNFVAVNVLIEKHNRYFPAESRLPMDPRTGDFALVNGEHYTKRLLDADWILERFPLRPAAARTEDAG
jgi:hypothetical protein